MRLNEKSMRYLEEKIPKLAELAVIQAYWSALASGRSVLEARDGVLVEVFPDGTEKIVKKIAPWTPVKKGQRFTRK